MDEREGKKRIAMWESKRESGKRNNKPSVVARAEDAIKRIEAAMGIKKSKKDESIRPKAGIAKALGNRHDSKKEDPPSI
jgi:hypothetical protein